MFYESAPFQVDLDEPEEEQEEEEDKESFFRRRCLAADGGCPKGDIKFKAHGPLTGNCVPSDRWEVTKDINKSASPKTMIHAQ